MAGFNGSCDPPTQWRWLVEAGLDRLPHPGSGNTLLRWQTLAAVAQHDLSLAKIFEGHTDALATLHEVGAVLPPAGSRIGLWAAEPPDGRVTFRRLDEGQVELRGTKRWCSGARDATHGLLTAWDASGSGPWLVLADMAQPAAVVLQGGWCAVGMAASASVDVVLGGVTAQLCGTEGRYLDRPGFWQGGAGVAACWFGGCVALGEALRVAAERVPDTATDRRHVLLAALGRADVELRSLAALFRESAAWIDAHPRSDARGVALRLRGAVDAAAHRLLESTGRALGATPYCRDPHFARLAADLPVFVRQTHGDRDLAALGQALVSSGPRDGFADASADADADADADAIASTDASARANADGDSDETAQAEAGANVDAVADAARGGSQWQL